MTILDLEAIATFHAGAPAPKILAQSGHARIVMFAFRKDQLLDKHSASSPITVQVISGKIDFSTEEERVTLLPGELLILEPQVPHKITALEETILLVYIIPNPKAHTLEKEVFEKLTPMIEI